MCTQRQRIRGLQLTLTRENARPRRLFHEDFEMHCFGLARLARLARRELGLFDWDVVMLGRTYERGGHGAGLPVYDEARLAIQILKYKNTALLRDRTTANRNQGHGRRLRM